MKFATLLLTMSLVFVMLLAAPAASAHHTCTGTANDYVLNVSQGHSCVNGSQPNQCDGLIDILCYSEDYGSTNYGDMCLLYSNQNPFGTVCLV